MKTPYNTTYGSLLNTKKVEDELTRYLSITNVDDLAYNYPVTGDVKIAFITGWNETEQNLPVWEHPILIKTVHNTQVIVSDLRRYVKKHDEQPVQLEEITKDENSVKFIILHTLLVKDYVEDNFSLHREVIKPSTTAFGIWIMGMVNTIVMLTPTEQFAVEIIASIYANRLYYPNLKDEDKDVILARVTNSKHLFKINKKSIIEIGDKYKFQDGGMLELVNNLIYALPEDKHQYITIDSLVGVMGNIWYGPGGSETPIIALEYMPTWLSILHGVITNRSYSKSRIGSLLMKHNRVIDSKVIEKHFNNYLGEIKV